MEHARIRSGIMRGGSNALILAIRVALGLASLGCMILAPTAPRAADEATPFPVDVWEPPFNQQRQHVRKEYTPLAHAAKPWRLCASIPHLKDDYWLAVNYALIQEARRLGVRLNLFEAGGYENLATQKQQIAACVKAGADALIVGAISADGLNDVLAPYAERGIPVIDLINGLNAKVISARAAADFYDMGFAAGQYLKKLAAGKAVRVAWFPGPKGAGWVSAGDQGFRDALKGTSTTIVDTSFGDTGIAAQTKLLNAAFDRDKNIDYVVGTAVTAEAAAQVLRERKLSTRVKVIAYYFSAAAYRGIQRGTIAAAPTDQTAVQAKLAVDLAVSVLEKQEYPKHISAPVLLVDHDNVSRFDVGSSLAPPGFRPIFSTTE
jgi:protein TorT